MVDKFSPEVLAKVVVSELRRVQEKLEALEAAGQLKPSNVTVSLSASHTAVTTSTAVAHQWPDGLPPSALKAVETAENARMEAAATTTTTAEQ